MSPHRRLRPSRPALEMLEDRRLLATQLYATSTLIHAIEGQEFTNQIANFYALDDQGNRITSSGNFRAKIQWGDGETTDGLIRPIGTTFDVYGTHTYEKDGQKNPIITVKYTGDQPATTDVPSLAVVGDAPFTAVQSTATATAGEEFTKTLATLISTNPNAAVGDFTVVIQWGDGTVSYDAQVVGSAGRFFVIGTHTYVREGIYTAQIDITGDDGGTRANAFTRIEVSNPTPPPPDPLPSVAVNANELRAVMTQLSAAAAARFAPLVSATMNEFGIRTPRERAAFLAQLAAESGGLKYWTEIASGRAYEGRRDLGNTHPGDGVRYKGRGPIQLTGRAAYRAAGKALGLDLENHPELVGDVAHNPGIGLRVAGWFWRDYKRYAHLNRLADSGNIDAISRVVNGGTNGLQARRTYYSRALRALTH